MGNKRALETHVNLIIALIVGVLILAIIIPALGIIYSRVVFSPNYMAKLFFKFAKVLKPAAATGIGYVLPALVVDLNEKAIACPCVVFRPIDWERRGGTIRDIYTNLDPNVINLLKREGYIPEITFFGPKLTSEEDIKKYRILATNYVVAKLIAVSHYELADGWAAGHDDARRVICFPYYNDEDIVIDEALVSAILASFKNQYCPKHIENYVDVSNSKYQDIVDKMLKVLKEEGKDPSKCINGRDEIKFVNSENDKYVFKQKDNIIFVKTWDTVAKENEFFRKYFEPKYLCVFIGVDDPDETYQRARIVARGYYIIRSKNAKLPDILRSIKNMLKDSELACYYVHLFTCPKWGPGTYQPFFLAYDFDSTPDTEGPLNYYLGETAHKKFMFEDMKEAIKELVKSKDLNILDMCELNGNTNFEACENRIFIIKIKNFAEGSESDAVLKHDVIPGVIKEYMSYITSKYPELDSSIVYYMLYINKDKKWNLIIVHPFAVLYRSKNVESRNILYYTTETGGTIKDWFVSLSNDVHPDFDTVEYYTYACVYDYSIEEYNCEVVDLGYIWDKVGYKIIWG